MAIGERIHFFRIMRGMTQKYLGMLVGFPERSADVRLAQYETGSRKPKAELTAALAQALDVVVFCQVLFPEKSVEIPCFRQGIFPTFGGH